MREADNPLELETRRMLFDTITQNPGLHFRELQRRTQLAVGALQYHLNYLEKKDLLKVESRENTKRYFAMKVERIMGEENVMPLLRQEKVRHVLLALLTSENKTLFEIAEITGIPYSTVSRCMERLVQSNVVVRVKRAKENSFEVQHPTEISKMLIQYKQSFLDELVDQFVDAWGSMAPEDDASS